MKILIGKNVFHAAIERIEWIFDVFSNICVSFSGGKDSTVLYHLVADVARKKGCQFSVLFIDWEVQFQSTIAHIQEMKEMYSDITSHFYWVALPLTTVSGVSQYQPEWICWDRRSTWVRLPPDDAITNESYFSFYRDAMTFEEFIPAFAAWFANGNTQTAILTGVRTDESLHRFNALTSLRKQRYASDRPWTTVSSNGFCTAYPLYDWKTKDIWIYTAKNQCKYNLLYDLMFRAGVPMKAMRVCEPFGPEQRRSLWLYHILEPETWGRVCARVAGAESGARYAVENGPFYAHRQPIVCPKHHTWKSYAFLLLNSMPVRTAEHYKNKIAVYLRWYQTRGYPDDIPDDIPDEQDKDLGSRDIPSWRRICKTLIKNDFWCKFLSFSPNKSENYSIYLKRMRRNRDKWGIMQ